MIRKSSLRCSILTIMMFVVIVISKGWTQDKLLTYHQAFEGAEPHIFNDLPDVLNWLDDETFLSWKSTTGSNKSQLMKTHVQNGEPEVFIDFSNLDKKFFKVRLGYPGLPVQKTMPSLFLNGVAIYICMYLLPIF